MFFHHVCIQTDCYEESLAFYRVVLGMEVIEETKDFHGRDYNTWLKRGAFRIELQTGKKEEPLQPFDKNREGLSHMCFCVEDLASVLAHMERVGYDKFKKKKGEIIYEVFGGKLFKVIAPEGTIIEFRDNEEL